MASGMGVSLRVTASCSQGGRRYMEDTFTVAYHPLGDGSVEYAYFGIFDGHGGDEASTFARIHLLNYIIAQEDFWSDEDSRIKRAIRKGFLDTHEAMWRDVGNWRKTPSGHTSTAGTTATICFVKKSKLYIGHVGDSGVVLGYKEKGEAEWRGKPLTKDHKPEDPDEHKRIESSGGKVQIKAGICRVVWNRSRVCHSGPVTRSAPPCEEIPFLAVARSLGDLWSFNPSSNTYVVSPDPDVTVLPLNVSMQRCLVFGTDGLWNVVTPDAAVAVIQTCEIHNSAGVVLDENPKLECGKKLGWINPARKLVDVALQRWSENQMRADNTSVIAVMLDHPLEEVKENCEHKEADSAPSVGIPLSRKGLHQHCADDIGVSDKNSRMLFATPGEWVGPPPVAARVKHESSWSLVEGDSQDSRVPSAVQLASSTGEDTAGHVVKVGDTLCSDPVCLTIKENSSARREETSLVPAQTEEIPVCSGDENTINTTMRQRVSLFPTSYTAKLENCGAKWQHTAVNSCVNSAIDNTVFEGSRAESLQKTNKNHPNNTECATSVLNQPKIRDQSNDREPFSSHSLQQTCWGRKSDGRKSVISSQNHQRSRWSKHNIKNANSSPAGAEHKRKRSLSDDRMVVSSYAMQNKNFKCQSSDVLMGSSDHQSQQKSFEKVCSDTKAFKLTSVQEAHRKNSDESVSSFTTKEKSQSHDRKKHMSNIGQQDKSKGSGGGDEPTIRDPQTQTRSAKRQVDSEQSVATSSQQQKRLRNQCNDRIRASSVIQENGSEIQLNEQLSVATREKTTCNKDSDLKQSVAPFPTRLRKRRSHSDNRVVITASINQKDCRRSKSAEVCRAISVLEQDNNYKADIDHRDLLPTCPAQKRRRRGQSHDRSSPVRQLVDSLNHAGDVQSTVSSLITHRGIRRSRSLDGRTYTPSTRQQRNSRRHSVASPSVVSSDVQQNRWEQASDRQMLASLPYKQKNFGNMADDRQASSPEKAMLCCSRNGYKCGKRWGKRRKVPSTHVGKLRRNAAVNRRRPSASSMVASSRSAWGQNSSVDSCISIVPPGKEPVRTLRSVTAAVIAESLPIAKKLRSSSYQAQSKCISGCGLAWKRASEHAFTKRSNIHSRNVQGVSRYHYK